MLSRFQRGTDSPMKSMILAWQILAKGVFWGGFLVLLQHLGGGFSHSSHYSWPVNISELKRKPLHLTHSLRPIRIAYI